MSEIESLSATSETIRLMEEDIRTDITDDDAIQSNYLAHLSSSLDRHKLLCRALRKLDNEIRNEVEGLLLSASRTVSNAKQRLEASRKTAEETVEGLKKADDSSISVQLPWVNGDGSHSTLGQDLGSVLPDERSLSPLVIPSSTATFPNSSATLPHTLEPGLHDHLVKRGINERQATSKTCPVPSPSTSFVYPNEAIFPQYEEMVNAINMGGSHRLWPWDIPWPILTPLPSDYPPKTSSPLMSKEALEDNLEVFFMCYSKWKGQPLRQTLSVMLLDWTANVDRIPFWMQDERAKAEIVVSCLSCLSENDSPVTYPS
jgi:hypothetical protein